MARASAGWYADRHGSLLTIGRLLADQPLVTGVAMTSNLRGMRAVVSMLALQRLVTVMYPNSGEKAWSVADPNDAAIWATA